MRSLLRERRSVNGSGNLKSVTMSILTRRQNAGDLSLQSQSRVSQLMPRGHQPESIPLHQGAG